MVNEIAPCALKCGAGDGAIGACASAAPNRKNRRPRARQILHSGIWLRPAWRIPATGILSISRRALRFSCQTWWNSDMSMGIRRFGGTVCDWGAERQRHRPAPYRISPPAFVRYNRRLWVNQASIIKCIVHDIPEWPRRNNQRVWERNRKGNNGGWFSGGRGHNTRAYGVSFRSIELIYNLYAFYENWMNHTKI